METTDWSNAVYSPAVKGDTSPYFHEIDGDHAGPGGGQGPGAAQVPNNFSEQEQYLLQQIEHNLYESGTTPGDGTSGNNGAASGGRGADRGAGANGKYEFGIDNLNFVLPEDMAFEQQSTAYPPSAANVNNTPNIMANNMKKMSTVQSQDGPGMFMSPILPGQNEKSYNNQHFYHKHQNEQGSDGQVMSHQPQSQHVRPDAVFTPLESPAVTPREAQVNSNKYPYSQPAQTSFEPLTSPALNAQPSDKRRSSSMFAPIDDHAPHKRRTPHGTPVLQANGNQTNRVKKSPSMKTRTSHVQKSLTNSPFEKLPDSGMDLQKNSTETTPMLPPQSKKVDIPGTSNGEVPATLMGFTMGVLAEQQHDNSSGNSHQGTPSHEPSRGNSAYSSSKILPKSSSSSETSPILHLEKSSISYSSSATNLTKTKSTEKPATKKASHKLAEQGRRNRMNMAVHELTNLIPQVYHDEVSIPSKATTIELASRYIRDLIKENNEMRYYNLER